MQPVTRAQKVTAIVLTLSAIVFVLAGGFYLRTAHRPGAVMPSAAGSALGMPKVTLNGLTVTFHPPEQLKVGANMLGIEFHDSKGQLIDAGTVSLNLDMNMPGMVMHSAAKVSPTGKPGQYRVEIKPEMAGDWMAQLSYNGERGGGKTNFKVTVK